MNKKGKILVIVLATVVMILALIILLPKNKPGHNPEQTGDKDQVNNQKTTDDKLKSAIIGTWYSNVPDSLTFNRDGTYKGDNWKGTSPWLIGGNYTIEDNTINLHSLLDGTATLNISEKGDTLSNHTYTYYKTKEQAELAIKEEEEESKRKEEESKHIPSIIEKLKGEWITHPRHNSYIECTYTEDTIEFRYYGKEKQEGQEPEDITTYAYEIISDTQMWLRTHLEQKEGGMRAMYSIIEKEGQYILTSPTSIYGARLYVKDID